MQYSRCQFYEPIFWLVLSTKWNEIELHSTDVKRKNRNIEKISSEKTIFRWNFPYDFRFYFRHLFKVSRVIFFNRVWNHVLFWIQFVFQFERIKKNFDHKKLSRFIFISLQFIVCIFPICNGHWLIIRLMLLISIRWRPNHHHHHHRRSQLIAQSKQSDSQ